MEFKTRKDVTDYLGLYVDKMTQEYIEGDELVTAIYNQVILSNFIDRSDIDILDKAMMVKYLCETIAYLVERYEERRLGESE